MISNLILVCPKTKGKRSVFFYSHVELVDDSGLDVRNQIGLRVVGVGRYDPRLYNEGNKAKGRDDDDDGGDGVE